MEMGRENIIFHSEVVFVVYSCCIHFNESMTRKTDSPLLLGELAR